MRASYCRVTVLAPRTRVDVALPADVAVGELVPMVLELLGEQGAVGPPQPWRMEGAAGGPLPPAATLDELGVLDGELLRIGPDAVPPAPPVFDDPVDALAATAGARVTDGRFATGVLAFVVLVASALLAGFPTAGPAPGWPGVLAVVVAACAAVTAILHAGRLAAGADRLPALTAAVAAVAIAAGAGVAAVPGDTGAAHVLLGAAAAGIAAAAAQAALRVVAPLLVGAVVAAVSTAAAALLPLRFGVPSSALAAGIGAAALAVAPLLPRAALRLAGLPRPLVPADPHELVAADSGPDLLPPAELAERADLARGYLEGLVGGCAVVAAVAALPAAAGGGWAGPAFAAVTAVVLGLRARSFADPGPARTLLAAAIGTGVGLAVVLALLGGPAGRLAAVVGLLLVAAVVSVGTARSTPVASPVSRRAVDVLEAVLVAAAVPLALGAMDVFALVRGL